MDGNNNSIFFPESKMFFGTENGFNPKNLWCAWETRRISREGCLEQGLIVSDTLRVAQVGCLPWYGSLAVSRLHHGRAASLGPIGFMLDPGGRAKELKALLFWPVPAQPPFCPPPCRPRSLTAGDWSLLPAHRPDQGQDPDQGGLCAGVCPLLALQDPRVSSPPAGALGLTTSLVGRFALRTTPARRLEHTFRPGARCCGRPASGRPPLQQPAGCRLASVAVDGNAARAAPWLIPWPGPMAKALDLLPDGSQCQNGFRAQWQPAVELLLAAAQRPVLSSVCAGQVLALPAELEQGEKGTAAGKNPQPRRRASGWPVPGSGGIPRRLILWQRSWPSIPLLA